MAKNVEDYFWTNRKKLPPQNKLSSSRLGEADWLGQMVSVVDLSSSKQAGMYM